MSNSLPAATFPRASSSASNIARSFSEVTSGIRDRARSGQPVRRNSQNAGGAEVALWRAHNMFSTTEHNARMRAAEEFDHETKLPGKRNGALGAIGYAIAGTNGATVYDPASQSGLVLSAQYRSTEAKFYSGQGDLSVTRKFETPIGTHDIRVGVYGADWGSTVFGVYQNYLVQVASQPKTLDLIAYDAQGAVRGYVTDNGALNDASSLVGGKYDAQMVAVYGTDTWDVTDKLRIDLGLRQEYYSYTGFSQTTAAYNLGSATTLADNSTRGFTGAIVNTKLKPKATNWTVGANYDLSRSFGVYARASQLEVPAYASSVAIAGSSFTASKAKLYEAGVKAVSGRSYLYVTGFYTKFDPLNASFTTFNPTTGRSDQVVNFVGSAEDKGMTEGNTAGDTLTGQGVPDAIFGRPLWGRNVRFSLGLKW
jgi:outer membrane receptor protein involved in Fe transport